MSPRRSIATAASGLAVLAALVLGPVACSVPYENEPLYRPTVEAGAAGAATPRAAPGSTAQRPAPDGQELPPTGAGPEPLDLARAIEVALERNRGVDIAERRVLIAKNRIDETYTYLYPRVTAEGRIKARNNDVGATFQGDDFVMSDRRTGTVDVQLLVPIYTFGQVSSRIDAASLNRDVAGFEATRARQDLRLGVSEAYYRILEAQKISGVLEDSIRVVRRQLQISRDFHKEGLVAKTDVLSAEVQLAKRQQQLIRAHNNVQLAVAALNRLLRYDVTRDTRVRDVLEAEPFRGSFVAALCAALRNRPDLHAAERRIALARAEYRITRTQNAPVVYGFGDYMYTTDSFALNDDWVVGGLALHLPIFDGLVTHTELRRKDDEISEAVDLHDDLVDDIVLAVKQAHLNVNEAARRLPVARKSIEQASENLRMIRDQYAEGWVTSTDVLVEEDRLARARSDYYQALYAYHDAYATLVHVVGGPPPAGPPSSPEPAAQIPKAPNVTPLQ